MLSSLVLSRSICRGTLIKSLQSKAFICQPKTSTQLVKLSPRITSTAVISSSHVKASAAQDHSHTKIWTAERFLSASLVGLLPVGIAFPNPLIDYVLALALTAHVHWGIEAIVVDYARPSVIGPALSRAALASVYALTVFTLGGLFYFNYNDVGLCQAIRMLWKL